MISATDLADCINELIFAQQTKKTTKTKIINALQIIKIYSSTKEDIIINNFIDAANNPKLKSEARKTLKQKKEAIIKIIDKYEIYYNKSESSSDDSSNNESDSNNDSYTNEKTNSDIASILVELRKRGMLEVSNNDLKLGDGKSNNECIIS